ncbi:hypothetical protein [Amycolatopsis thailandensis]|uniref:hypothetical protein n=1 Tax=Amycolatopsis thailandensis TaxID=589330 RepID=UPI00363FA3D5
MTSADDGLAHEISDEAFADGNDVGVYVALCDAVVRPTPGGDPIGRPCPRCIARLLATRGLGPSSSWSMAVPEQSRGRARHRRRGRLHALLLHGGRRER